MVRRRRAILEMWSGQAIIISFLISRTRDIFDRMGDRDSGSWAFVVRISLVVRLVL